jgi:exodeoxyribonuclease-5
VTDDLLSYDQIIVGTHRTRCRINNLIRAKLGFAGPLPLPGEKLICLKNNHAKGLLNGTMWDVLAAGKEDDGFVPLQIRDDTGRIVDAVPAPVEGFTAQDGGGNDLPGDPFTFGYAVTCHKAQGSQWDSVCVVDESYCFRADRARWLYTAITRAARRLTMVKRWV